MANAFRIFSDSSCDIIDSYLKECDVTRIPFYVSFDQETYRKEIEELSLSDFYGVLTKEKIFPKTSMPSVEDYRAHFEKAHLAGESVLCICITPLFSGSFQAATTAKEMLLEDYPDAEIAVVNSMQATGAQGLTVLEAVKMRNAGYSLNETVSVLEKIIPTSRIVFTVGTLEYLQRGGRIGKVSALAGSILNLQPLIILHDGELMPYGTVRGRKKALAKIVAMTEAHFLAEGLSYDDFAFGMINGYSSVDETLAVKARVEELIGHPIDLPLFPVGVTIGTYTGPDPIGITFIRRYDRV